MNMQELYGDVSKYSKNLKIIGFEKGVYRFLKRLNLDNNKEYKILDIACGDGMIGINLIKILPKSTLLATDINQSFLDETLKNSDSNNINRSKIKVAISDLNNPEIITLNNKKMKLEDNSFDIISIGGAIGYSKDTNETLKKIIKLMKKDGYLITLEMKSNILTKKICEKYNYNRIPIETLKNMIEKYHLKSKIIKFSILDFPANLTRIGLISKK